MFLIFQLFVAAACPTSSRTPQLVCSSMPRSAEWWLDNLPGCILFRSVSNPISDFVCAGAFPGDRRQLGCLTVLTARAVGCFFLQPRSQASPRVSWRLLQRLQRRLSGSVCLPASPQSSKNLHAHILKTPSRQDIVSHELLQAST